MKYSREKDVARQFGLGEQALFDFRQALCTKGVHWDVRNRYVVWTEEGLARLAQLVNLTLAELPRVEEKPPVWVIVHTKTCSHGNIVLAHFEGKPAEILRVRVKRKDSLQFRPRSRILVHQVEGTLYEHRLALASRAPERL